MERTLRTPRHVVSSASTVKHVSRHRSAELCLHLPSAPILCPLPPLFMVEQADEPSWLKGGRWAESPGLCTCIREMGWMGALSGEAAQGRQSHLRSGAELAPYKRRGWTRCQRSLQPGEVLQELLFLGTPAQGSCRHALKQRDLALNWRMTLSKGFGTVWDAKLCPD